MPSNLFGPVVALSVSHDALISDAGKTVRLGESARGALVVVGYTRCTDACPLALAKAVAAAGALQRDARPDLFFVTVDPAHDTPAALRRYLAAWKGDVVGLTGDPQALRRVAASLGASGAAGAASDHDTRLFLIDRTGALQSEVAPDISVDDLRLRLAVFADSHVAATSAVRNRIGTFASAAP